MIELKGVHKTFKHKKEEFSAINDISLKINDGEIFGIIGFSGAGKSTLVRCMNLLEKPDSGDVIIDGVNIVNLSNSELNKVRKKIGMIFQQFNLLEQRNVFNNIRYPLEISHVNRDEANKKVSELLKIVGLEDKASSYPSELSGGQKQRVAIARALASDPDIILCDEATSALDPITTKSILELLQKLNHELGVTIVIITHEMSVVSQICERVAVIDNGSIIEEGKVSEVFLHPSKKTTRKLIDPGQGNQILSEYPNAIRLAFDGSTTGEPVVASIVKECDTNVNILNANINEINGKPFGQMIIDIDDKNSRDKVFKYLDSRGISYECGGDLYE